MTTIINASSTNGLVQTADGSGVLKVQSNGVTTNALAWVNFDGTTSPGTIRSAYNIGSVTRNSTGNYTLNFTNSLTDANYVVVATHNNLNSASSSSIVGSYTTSSVVVATYAGVTGVVNPSIVNVAVFGN